MTATATLSETEFSAWIADAVSRKVKGQLLTETRGGYNLEIAGCEGTFRITVSGGPADSWTRRQNITKPNVKRTAAILFAELNGLPEPTPRPTTTTVREPAPQPLPIEVAEARNAIADAIKAQRMYGPQGIPTHRARTLAGNAILKALAAGFTESDIYPAA